MKDNFKKKFFKISVVGAGYIGAVLGAVLAEKGNYVTEIDVNENIINSYKKGKSPVNEPGLEKLIKKVISNGQLTATNDYSSIKEADVILITVGTPLKEDGSADKSAINNVVSSISPYIKDGQLIIVKSTVPPFTTENDICTPLRKISKVHVAFCPERLAEGNAIEECKSIPVVVGGVDKESGEKAQEFWESSLNVRCINVENARSAELVKLADNAWIDLNIAIAFELAKLADHLNIDVLEVIKAANSLPKGQSFVNILSPSIGVGGYCLTKDPWFLNSFAESYGSNFKTAITSRKVNEESPNYAAKTISKEITKRFPKTPNNSVNIGILGLSFKNNTGDCRFTPTIKLINNLSKSGFKIKIFDPYLSEKDYGEFVKNNIFKANSINEVLSNSHCVAFLTGHKEFKEINLIQLKDNLVAGGIIFDGRMFFSKGEIDEFINSGFKFKGIGR